MRKNREEPGRLQGNEAAPDDRGADPRQVGPESAGQSGDPQRLSTIEDADNQSTEELADSDQALEAGRVEGVEGCRRASRTAGAYARRICPAGRPAPARVSDRKKAS